MGSIWLEPFAADDIQSIELDIRHQKIYKGMLDVVEMHTYNGTVVKHSTSIEIDLRTSDNIFFGPWTDVTYIITKWFIATHDAMLRR